MAEAAISLKVGRPVLEEQRMYRDRKLTASVRDYEALNLGSRRWLQRHIGRRREKQ